MLEEVRDRIAKTLSLGPQIDLSLEPSRRFLSRYIDKKLELVILVVDIVGSTQLSLTMPKRLARIIQVFSQEISIIINKYGGYVLKYAGDAVIACFAAEFDKRKACINAIAAAKDMKDIIEFINLELAYSPSISIKISINLGSDLVVLYGKSMQSHIDIVGSTISIASKISIASPPSSIIITHNVYKELDDKTKGLFNEVRLDNEILDGTKTYELSSNAPLNASIDGKAMVYRTIDELDIEPIAIKNPSLAIRDILKICIKEGFEYDVYRSIVIALMHFMLSKSNIPSERNVKINDQTLDIVIPSLRVLISKPEDAIVIAFPDGSIDLDHLSKFQPNKENIWLIFGYARDNYPNDRIYRIYLPDQFASHNLNPLSFIIDDIKGFLKSVRGFKILSS